MVFLVFILWFVRTTKALLFWLYLWQLKEYHIGRFVDHFRTQKGKQLLVNPLLVGKVVLFGAGFFLDPVFFLYALLLVYFVETIQGGRVVFQRRLLKPTITAKTTVLVVVGALLEVTVLLGAFFLFIASVQVSLVFLLAIDIILPVLVSLIVLLLQPFVVVARNRTIAIATAKRKKHENLIVIGITGSYGKTSTKEFLSHILSAKFRVLKTKEHQNSETAIAKTIVQDLTKEHQVFVCEMGAYGKGGVQLLASMAQPTIGVVTGVNEQHLSLFGTMANLQRAEGGEELLESLPRDGAVVLNYNSKHLKHADLPGKYSELLYVRICSTQEKKDVWAESIQVGKEHVSFVLHFKDGDTSPVVMKLLGKHNVENALLAAAVAKDLGMKAKEIAQQLRTVVPSVGVMKLKKGKQGLQIIDSSYSANPNGVIASLEYLSLWPGKKILVMPSLIELGQASREAHKRIGKEIAHICDLVFVTTADHIQDLQEGAGEKSSIIQLQENPQEVVKAIHAFAKPGDVVLLEGRVPAQLLELL